MGQRKLRLCAGLCLALAAVGGAPGLLGAQGSSSSPEPVLAPWLEDGSQLELPAREAEVPVPVRNQVLALLAEYEAAYQARDIERLSRVWQMDAYERFVMAGLFSSYRGLSMSVEPGPVRSAGQTLLVDFDQRTSRLGGTSGAAQLRASLKRRATGEWVVYQVRKRSEGTLDSDGQPDLEGPLKAMREFQAAFQNRELERLSRVWLMSEAERDTMRKVFTRAPDTRFEIELLGARAEGDGATVDFDQRFTAPAGSPARQGLDRLRAELAPRPGGTWIISRLVSRPR